MSICTDPISAAPLGSVNAKAIVWVELFPLFGITDTGDGSPLLPATMVSPALAPLLSDPLVPVTVAVSLPPAAPEPAVMVSVLEPEPATVVGLKLPVTPVGSP